MFPLLSFADPVDSLHNQKIQAEREFLKRVRKEKPSPQKRKQMRKQMVAPYEAAVARGIKNQMDQPSAKPGVDLGSLSGEEDSVSPSTGNTGSIVRSRSEIQLDGSKVPAELQYGSGGVKVIQKKKDRSKVIDQSKRPAEVSF